MEEGIKGLDQFQKKIEQIKAWEEPKPQGQRDNFFL